jgi:hypothetical protein
MSGLFPSGFPTKILYTFFIFTCTTCSRIYNYGLWLSNTISASLLPNSLLVTSLCISQIFFSNLTRKCDYESKVKLTSIAL